MARNRIGRASAALVAAGVLALLTTTDAEAWTNGYCGALISTWSWCGDGSDHTYDTNKGWYNGLGTVRVCQRLINSNTRAIRSGSSCGNYSYVFKDYGSTTSTLFEAEVTHDSGGARHTIYGEAVA